MTDVVSCPCPSAPEAAPAARPASGDQLCRPVVSQAETAEHLRIRREVFVREQRLFSHDDADEHDDDPATVHVLGLIGGRPAGAVRLYPLPEPGLWKGDRLAVLPEHRQSHIGRPLVRLAVSIAAARGGSRMVASVQAHNTRFFVALGWTPLDEPFDLLGVPHRKMIIEVSR